MTPRTIVYDRNTVSKVIHTQNLQKQRIAHIAIAQRGTIKISNKYSKIQSVYNNDAENCPVYEKQSA